MFKRLFPRLLTFIIFATAALLLVYSLNRPLPLATSLLLFLNLVVILSAIYFRETGVAIFGSLGLLVTLLYSLRLAQFTIFPVLLLLTTSFISYIYCLKATHFTQRQNVELANVEEEKNLLAMELEHRRLENTALKQKLERYTALKNLTELLSSVLSLEEALSLITSESYRIIGKSNTCLLYLVAQKEQKLYLANKKARDPHYEIRAKQGDVFDNWVFKRRTRLMIKDVHKDFRFNPDQVRSEELRGVRSLIAAPLISANKVVGTLRLDNISKAGLYNADDLRLLDIISDLAAVAIQNAVFYQRTKELAITDGLTGLLVYRHFQERFDQELTRSAWTNSHFAFLMLDIDNFKSYNDRYGHIAGDIVLKEIARLIHLNANPGDIVARYGGEEFGLLLLDTTKPEAQKTAERIRKSIAEEKFILRRQATQVSISGGLAAFPEDEREKKDLISKADLALYRAKAEGRNRICTS